MFLIYASLAASAFLSATLLPGSSEALLVSLLASETGSVLMLILVASIGNIAGSCVNWLLGRFCMQYQDTRWFPLSEKQIARGESWFHQYGRWSLLLAWLPVIGDPITLAAGLARVRLVPFLLLVSIGKTGRYLVLAYGILTALSPGS